MISRRDFLKGVSEAIAAAGAISPWLAWAADDSVAVPGKDGMILRSYRFLDLEMPPEYANSWITPVQHFFVRNHMHEPNTLDAGDWRLSIGGEVENPLSLSLAPAQNRIPHRYQYSRMCGQRQRALPTARPWGSMAKRSSGHRPIRGSASEGFVAADRTEANRQTRNVPWPRRSPRESAAVHSQHSH